METRLTRLLLLLWAGCFITCNTYYKANNIKPENASARIDSLQKENRFFILRNGTDAYHMKQMTLSQDQKTLSTFLEDLPEGHLLYFTKGRDGKPTYKPKDPFQANVTNEVHFYIPEDSMVKPGNYTLDLSKVNRIEVLEKDKGRTTNSYLLGALGYTVGAIAIVAIIVAATKSSCPFVAAYDGNDYALQGEIYGGAIYPQLERQDYLPLSMMPYKDGSLRVKITNELQEKQFTDYVKLWRISHPANSKILVNERGELFSVSDALPPVSASLNNSRDVLPELMEAHDQRLLYMDDSSRQDATNEVVLQFKRPAVARRATLALTLKNSYWLDLLYGEVMKKLGTYYGTYAAGQKRRSAEELLQGVIEEKLPLTVSVRTINGWRQAGSINTIGPLAYRDVAMNIDLTETGADVVDIKLSSGFMFWELDYAGIDFTAADRIHVEKMEPAAAKDERGMDVLNLLQKEDHNFLAQPEIGNAATIVFRPLPKPANNENVFSYILETKGYYEHIRSFSNMPDLKFLAGFSSPGHFPVFGMSLYKEMKQKSLEDLSKAN